jgi:alkaline phosphatase D
MRGRGAIVRCSHQFCATKFWRRNCWHHEESTTITRSRKRFLHDNSAFAAADEQAKVQFTPLKELMTTTAPKRIVFGSCSSQTEDLSYWERILAISPDLVILMGDNVYGKDGGLEQAYVQLKSHPSFRRVVCSATPLIATLDDNDYYHSGGNKEAAKREFLRFLQIPESDQRWMPNRGVYTSYMWTNQLHVVLLDVRYSKSPFLSSSSCVSGGPPYIPDDNSSKTVLGTDQWHWLEQQLKIPVKLRLIVSPMQVLAEGHFWDCWNMFPRERERLLSLLSADSSTNIILSGDRHVAGLYQKDGLREVTSSSLTHSVPPGRLDHEVDSTRVGDFAYVNNFGLAELNWDNEDVAVQVSIRRADTGDTVGKEWTWNI